MAKSSPSTALFKLKSFFKRIVKAVTPNKNKEKYSKTILSSSSESDEEKRQTKPNFFIGKSLPLFSVERTFSKKFLVEMEESQAIKISLESKNNEISSQDENQKTDPKSEEEKCTDDIAEILITIQTTMSEMMSKNQSTIEKLCAKIVQQSRKPRNAHSMQQTIDQEVKQHPQYQEEMYCVKCGTKTHNTNMCIRLNTPHGACFKCKQYGHFSRECQLPYKHSQGQYFLPCPPPKSSSSRQDNLSPQRENAPPAIQLYKSRE